MTHVAEWKKKYVDELVNIILEKPVVGVVNIHGIPAKQMQEMRKTIRGMMILKGSKNTLMKLAFERAAEQGKTGINRLAGYIDGQCAIVATDMNPFRLYKQFVATMTPTPAKGGEIAPEDIWVRKGDTPFKPGPVVSEFQKAGIPAAIDRGKIIIRKDTLLVKKGEVISREVANALTKLEIFPLTVGMDLMAAYEDGTIFDKSTLSVDPAQFIAQIKQASMQALNLAVFVGYPTKQSIVPLIQKAFNQALSLSVSTGYPTSDSITMLLLKARAQMLVLASLLDPEALDTELRDALSSSRAAPPSPTGEEKKEAEDSKAEEEETEEEVSEEEAAAGLGALFG